MLESKKFHVSKENKSVRFFKSDFLDFFSRIPWYVPLFIYVPLLAYGAFRCFISTEISLAFGIGFFIVGIIAWTLAEYFTHKVVFHWDAKSEWGKHFVFMAHGAHHNYPQDALRLVMPPAVSIPLAILFYYLFYFIFGAEQLWPMYIGFVGMYLFYDMDHHYVDPELGYGISNRFWDKLFGTCFANGDKASK